MEKVVVGLVFAVMLSGAVALSGCTGDCSNASKICTGIGADGEPAPNSTCGAAQTADGCADQSVLDITNSGGNGCQWVCDPNRETYE